MVGKDGEAWAGGNNNGTGNFGKLIGFIDKKQTYTCSKSQQVCFYVSTLERLLYLGNEGCIRECWQQSQTRNNPNSPQQKNGWIRHISTHWNIILKWKRINCSCIWMSLINIIEQNKRVKKSISTVLFHLYKVYKKVKLNNVISGCNHK